MAAEPGWYPDPRNSGLQWWWDGAAYTESRPTPTGEGAVPTSSVQRLQQMAANVTPPLRGAVYVDWTGIEAALQVFGQTPADIIAVTWAELRHDAIQHGLFFTPSLVMLSRVGVVATSGKKKVFGGPQVDGIVFSDARKVGPMDYQLEWLTKFAIGFAASGNVPLGYLLWGGNANTPSTLGPAADERDRFLGEINVVLGTL